MTNIIPKLNLNKHPRDVDDNSLVYAENMMLDDNNILSSEYSNVCNEDIYNKIKDSIAEYEASKYTGENIKFYIASIKVISATTINNEIVFYSLVNSSTSTLFATRYDDKNDKIVTLCDIEYHNGNILSKGFYNNNKLIVVFSEYFDDSDNNYQQVPLKIFDFGTWDDDTSDIINRNKKEYQSHYSEVSIPNVKLTRTNGFLYKGWYFLFIRYKKYNNNYTSWYNLNCSTLLDTYKDTTIFNYLHKAKYWGSASNGSPFNKMMHISLELSDNKDTCNNGFYIKLNEKLDTNYSCYQIGYIVSTKTYTKCYRTEDIDIKIKNNIELSIKDVEYSASDMIENVNVFYNVKAFEILDNKLYIGNYEEKRQLSNAEIKEKLSKITVKINDGADDDNEDDTKDDNVDDENKDNLDIYGLTRGNYDYPPYHTGTKIGSTYGEKQDDGSYLIKLKDCLFIYLNIMSGYDVGGYCDFDAFDVNHKIASCLLYGGRKFSEVNYNTGSDDDKNNVQTTDLSYWQIYSDGYDPKIVGNDGQYTTYMDSSYWSITLRSGDLGRDITIFDGTADNAKDALDKIKIKIWPNSYDKTNNTEKNAVLIVDGTEYELDSGFEGGTIANNKTYYLTTDWWNGLVRDPDDKNDIKHKPNIQLAFYPMLANRIFVIPKSEVAHVPANKTYSTIDNSKIYPGQSYFLCAHFVDKYGQVTQGYPLNLFNVKFNRDEYDKETNILKTELDYGNHFKSVSIKIELDCKNDFIKENFVSYFISYAYMENTVKGFYLNAKIPFMDGGNTNSFAYGLFNEKLNYEDEINLAITKYKTLKESQDDFSDIITADTYALEREYNMQLGTLSEEKNFDDIKLSLKIADTYNNILLPTRLEASGDNIDDFSNPTFGLVIFYNEDKKYYKENKILIPCCQHQSIYDDDYIYINTHNGFYTNNIALLSSKFFYNSTLNQYELLSNNRPVYYDPASTNSGTTSATTNDGVIGRFLLFKFVFSVYDELPFYVNRINNSPAITFTPAVDNGKHDDETDYVASQVQQTIVELKNTVDLLQCPMLPIYKCYPKTYVEYNPNEDYYYKMTNFIRRSNSIQDESNNVAIRNFKSTEYKVVNDDYGAIVNLVVYNNKFLIHTTCSLFELSMSNSMNNQDDIVKVGQSDIFDVNILQVFSNNNIGGIDNAFAAVLCRGGYIFYSYIDKHIYKFGTNIELIDSEIYNYIKNIDINKFELFDDTQRNRIMMNINGDTTLSYNYNVEHFISIHSYNFNRLYNTILCNYILTLNGLIYKYDYDSFNKDEINNTNIVNQVDVIINSNYNTIKYLEYIIYKIYQVVSDVNDLEIPYVDYIRKYSPNWIRIYNDNCDTGDIDITIDSNTVNKVEYYKKPYWRLGNWHFNAIRDNISYYDSTNIKADEMSRIYGNYFVVKFKFISEKRVKIETLDSQTTIGELI